MAAEYKQQNAEATDETRNQDRVVYTARALFDAGIVVFPASAKAKHPDRVTHWAAEHYPPIGCPDEAEHTQMFSQRDVERLFVVCGKRSGGVICFDFDQEGFFEQWQERLPDGVPERLYVEQSQRSGGHHVVFKVAEETTTCVPARDPRNPDGTDGKVRIEVRGEGNGFIAAPSVGYTRIQGDLTKLLTLTKGGYQALLGAAAAFNACEPRPVADFKPRAERPADSDERPGDRFNRESGQKEVLALFEKHGYTIGRRSGANVDITRPGATSETSGNVNADGVTHMFSTNTAFEPSASGDGKGHSPFEVYTILEHSGNYSAAGKALAAQYAPRPIHTPRGRAVEESGSAVVEQADPSAVAGDQGISVEQAATPLEEPTEGRPTPIRATTDLGNAERLIDRFGHNLRYSAALGWLVWNDSHWEQDNVGRVEMLAKQTARDMLREAGDADDYEKRKALAKWAIRSESAASLRNMVEVARTEPGVPVTPDDLDTNAWLFTVANGTLDLRTGTLRAHRREDLITKGTPVVYDPKATCPLWMAFLHRIMEGDETRVKYLQRAIGYSLTGDTSERKMFVLHGKGKNGKSTLLSGISELVGAFAMRTATETLMQKRNEGIPNDIAKLRGARFVFASEAEDGKRLAESLIKDLTGEDRIAARFMRAEWFEFQPKFKIWLSTNHRPEIKGTDDAIWDRVRLIPFNVRFSDDEQRPKYEVMAGFRAEMSGILNWALEGCLDWQREGLGSCPVIDRATADYRAEMDTLGAWLSEECVQSPIETEAASALYTDYKRWADNASEKAVTAKQFAAQMAERGFQRKHTKKGSSYIGIRVKTLSEQEGKTA